MRLRDLCHGEGGCGLEGAIEKADGIASIEIERVERLVEKLRGSARRTRESIPLSIGRHVCSS
jgi:hypothetical protein